MIPPEKHANKIQEAAEGEYPPEVKDSRDSGSIVYSAEKSYSIDRG